MNADDLTPEGVALLLDLLGEAGWHAGGLSVADFCEVHLAESYYSADEINRAAAGDAAIMRLLREELLLEVGP